MQNFSQLIFKKGLENLKNNNFDEAEEEFEKLNSLHPDNLGILNNLALIYFRNKKFFKSEKTLKKIIQLGKKDKNIIEFLILNLKKQDKIKELEKYISEEKGIIDSKYQILEKILCPTIIEDQNEIDYYRNRTLNNLKLEGYDKNLNLDIDSQLLDPPIFNFSYDQYNNLELNKNFVKLFRDTYPQLNKTYNYKKEKGDKIKIGFISKFFTNHTIGKLFQGIIFNLDSKKFDVSVFHLENEKQNISNNFLKKESESKIKNFRLPKEFNEKVKIILRAELDLIFYPDIGLSTELYYLTFLKLAKKQITSWGHPESTCNTSIDYFLSSELLETKNAQDHYSEKLLLSKYLPMYFYKPNIKKIDDNDISKNNIYSCPQTMFKIHPDFDEIIKKILLEDKKAKIYFIKDKDDILFKKFYERIKKKIINHSERIHFIDRLNYDEYINHCGQASVLLDPLYFGSGNSFHESMFYGTKTVTLPTQYLKSRIVSGAYKQMGVDQPPIVNSVDEYVNIAVEIANKDQKKLLEEKKYYQNCADKKLYENKNSLLEIERIFLSISK